MRIRRSIREIAVPRATCLLATGLLSWVLSACAPNAESRNPAPRRGTQQMADTLAALYARARAVPQNNAFLNRERADAIERDLATRGGQMDLEGRYLLAQERLAAGQTREAISEFEFVIGVNGMSNRYIDPQKKILFDFLALSWLRLGEQENCQSNPAANVCILPLDGAARHEKQEGARKAISVYKAILHNFPNDLGSRYLLNIAYMAVGGYPDSVPPNYVMRGLKARPDATFPLFQNVAPLVGVAVDGLSGGLAVEDFNRDGHLDMFMTSWGMNDPVKLLIANGKGGYSDHTPTSGLTGIVGGLNVTHADYDNDGFSDVFVMRGAWLGDAGLQPNSLLRNRGDGTFEDVTFAAGLFSLHPTPTAAWADFNLDGFLDLFVGNESGVANGLTSHPSELFLNNGNGTFRDVSKLVGMNLDAFVKGATWGDVNNDGLPDLYASVLFGPNKLYINRGGASIDNWRFEEQSVSAGVDRPFASFPTWFWDFDQDGWDDLLVLSYDIRKSGSLHDAVAAEYLDIPLRDSSAIESSRLYRNNRNGTFTDITKPAGLADKVIFAMGSNFGDLDNDGWLDVYVGTGNPDLRSVIPNRMFRNVNGQRVEEVTLEGGFGHIQKGHGTAFVDLDRDGDSDVYMVMGGAYQGDRFSNVLFENPGSKSNAWVGIELEGRTANRSAIGARVRVDIIDAKGKARSIHRTVGTGGSFGAGSLALTVGVGPAQRIDCIEIKWPDKTRSVSTHRNVELRRHYRIVQGAEAVALNRPPVPLTHEGGVHMHGTPATPTTPARR